MILAAFAFAAPRELSMREALDLAVEQNPDRRAAALAEAIARIDARRARLDRLDASLGADAAGNLGFEKAWDEDPAGLADASWDLRARLSLPLYAGGAIQANIDGADAAAEISAADLAITERGLVRAAYTAYWNVKAYELQIAAEEEGLALTRQALDIIRAKAEAGLAAGIDVNRSQVDLYAQQAQLVADRSARAQAEAELARLLHLDGELTLSEAPPAAQDGPVAPGSPDARPELRRKAEEIAQAEAAVRAARAGTLPTVALGATAGVGNSAAGYLDADVGAFEPDDLRPRLDGSVGLSLSWDLFDLFATRDAVDQAKLAVQVAEAAALSERDAAVAELRQAATAVSELRERLPLTEAQVALARDNLQIVQGLYAQGSATLLDLFDAQTSFRQARTQGASLRVQLAVAEYDLRWLRGEDPLGATP